MVPRSLQIGYANSIGRGINPAIPTLVGWIATGVASDLRLHGSDRVLDRRRASCCGEHASACYGESHFSSNRSLLIVAFCLVLAVGIEASVWGAPPRIGLEPGVAGARTLRGDGEHVFEIDLPVGRSWQLDVTAQGNEVLIGLNFPGLPGDTNSQRHRVIRTLYGLGWTETLAFKSPFPGNTRIHIRAATQGAPVGSYEILLKAVADESPRERQAYLAAEMLTESAELLTQVVVDTGEGSQDRDGMLDQAIHLLEQALDRWRALGDRRLELHGMVYLAQALHHRGEPARAAKILAEALPLARGSEQVLTRALLLDRIGFAHLRQGDLDRAGRTLERAQELWQAENQWRGQAWTRATLCLLDLRQGAWDASRRCYEELLPAVRTAGEQQLEAKLENSLGGVYANLGEPALAIDSYHRALALSRILEDLAAEAKTRNNLGALFRSLGEPEAGIVHYQAALAFFRRTGDSYWQARTLNNLGYVFLVLGRLERADSFFREALVLRRQVKDRRGEAVTLRNLGRVAMAQGRSGLAIQSYAEALAMARALGDRRGEANALRLLGTAYHASRASERAREHLDLALTIRRDLGDRPGIAAVLTARGEAQLDAGGTTGAKSSFEEALSIYRAIRDPIGEAGVLYGLARVARSHDRVMEAERYLRSTIGLVESLRIRIADPSLRATFLSVQRGAFESLIDLLMDRHLRNPTAGYDRAAFEIRERAGARTLIDLLEAPAARLDRDIAPELRQRWLKAQRHLDAKIRRQLKVLSRRPTTVVEEITTVESEAHKALAALESVHAEIRRSSPRYGALDAAEPLDVAGAQRLLDPDTVLLEFALGEERSFLWVVTPDAAESFELPARAALEALALQAHDALSKLDLRSLRTSREAARELSRQILPPVVSSFEGRRLVVVADGALHYVPFATLPILDETAEGGEVPLLTRWEVVHLPSASALALQRRLLAAREPAPKTAVVFADPVFHATDPRVVAGPGRAVDNPADEASSQLIDPARAGIGDFPRLPQSRKEALAIADLAPEGQVLTLLDFDANRDRVISSGLEVYRILHFATHALLHPQNPELSGLVLAQVDAAGRARNGFLNLHDLLGLKLRADLVVLSGCQTALGQEVRGEGFVGLARGFLYSGVPRVVASLWQVEDDATAVLMEGFYRRLLKEGESASAALRGAQLTLREDRRFKDPHFWGAFQFQGDWQP